MLSAVVLIGLILHFQGADTRKNEISVITSQESVNVSVEIADTESKRRKGLMYRRNLGINEGMIFVFPDESPRSFWMKNTYIPLDIVFIDSDGNVLNIEEAYPQPDTPDNKLDRYRSIGDAKYVLELNSSFSEKYDLNTNDRINFYNTLK